MNPIPVVEIRTITTFDGVEFIMDDSLERAVLATPLNLGMPPVDYLTRKGYKQDGETETAINVNPRQFTITYRFTGTDREIFWEQRHALLEACRYNRGGVLTLNMLYNEGETSRSIKARAYGPIFGQDDGNWDEHGYTETLQFIANDPFLFDPDETIIDVSAGEASELAFDIAFDDDGIYFDDTGFFNLAQIPYEGTVYTFPVIEIDGPFSAVTIEHQNLGIFIQVLESVGIGGTLIIDTENDTVATSSGVSLYTKLAPGSNVSQFVLEAAPDAPNGVNSIQFNINDFTLGVTAVRIRFNTRYMGI